MQLIDLFTWLFIKHAYTSYSYLDLMAGVITGRFPFDAPFRHNGALANLFADLLSVLRSRSILILDPRIF
jgi:hypothetical protein